MHLAGRGGEARGDALIRQEPALAERIHDAHLAEAALHAARLTSHRQLRFAATVANPVVGQTHDRRAGGIGCARARRERLALVGAEGRAELACARRCARGRACGRNEARAHVCAWVGDGGRAEGLLATRAAIRGRRRLGGWLLGAARAENQHKRASEPRDAGHDSWSARASEASTTSTTFTRGAPRASKLGYELTMRLMQLSSTTHLRTAHARFHTRARHRAGSVEVSDSGLSQKSPWKISTTVGNCNFYGEY